MVVAFVCVQLSVMLRPARTLSDSTHFPYGDTGTRVISVHTAVWLVIHLEGSVLIRWCVVRDIVEDRIGLWRCQLRGVSKQPQKGRKGGSEWT
jgi:hypothetical protein